MQMPDSDVRAPTPITEWFYAQQPDVELYIYLASTAMQSVKHPHIKKAVIFNSADGPSALGIAGHILFHSPDAHIVVTDKCEDVAHACKQFLQNYLPQTGDVESAGLWTEDIHRSHVSDADMFVSFEPIGDLHYAFSTLYPKMRRGNQIVIVSRGLLGHGIQGLCKVARDLGVPDHLTIVDTEICLLEGNVYVGILEK